MFDDSLMGAIKWSLWFVARYVRKTKGTDTFLCGVQNICNHAFAKTDVHPMAMRNMDDPVYFL